MVATDHSVYSINSDVHEEPVLVYNTTHLIRGLYIVRSHDKIFLKKRVIASLSRYLARNLLFEQE